MQQYGLVHWTARLSHQGDDHHEGRQISGHVPSFTTFSPRQSERMLQPRLESQEYNFFIKTYTRSSRALDVLDTLREITR